MQLVDETAPGLQVLAEVIQAVADRERDARPTLAVVGEVDDGE